MAEENLTVRERLFRGDYKNQVPFPDDRKFKQDLEKDLEEVRRNFVGTLDQINKVLEEVEWRHKTLLRNAKEKYSSGEREAYIKFKKDLFSEYDVTNNPRADKVFSLAWSYGHSDGYGSVINHFEDLVELIV